MPFWSAGLVANSSGFAIRLGVRECPAPPRHSNPLRSLAAMLWQRSNIGSRVNREVHARFWERAEVKFLRATRHPRRFELAAALSAPIHIAAELLVVNQSPPQPNLGPWLAQIINTTRYGTWIFGSFAMIVPFNEAGSIDVRLAHSTMFGGR